MSGKFERSKRSPAGIAERLGLLFSDGSLLILPEAADVTQARREATSCDENEKDPAKFTRIVSLVIKDIKVVEVDEHSESLKPVHRIPH